MEDKIIYEALVEYENNHYMNEGTKWQKTINNLIDKYGERVKNGH